MRNILPAVDKIFGGEKAIALYEMHLQSPGCHGFHRYQIIHVPRNGIICEWRKDMGSADNYKGISQLRIPSLMEHTVDELKAMANELRVRRFDIKDFLELDNYKPG
jgi:hypothetical protein